MCPALSECGVGGWSDYWGHYSLYVGPVGGFLSERVMGMEWDGGEVPVGGEAIRGKDTV